MSDDHGIRAFFADNCEAIEKALSKAIANRGSVSFVIEGLPVDDEPAPDLRGLPEHLWRDNNG